MTNHGHDHERTFQPDEEDAAASEFQMMEIALREILLAKGVITTAELRVIYEKMDQRGPHNGARMVAKAWREPEFRALMLSDGTEAARAIGLEPSWLHLIVVENTAQVHNMVVCTLCSCYPWPLLGLPPDWYKSRAYRGMAVKNPRALLREFGTVIADDVDLRVHDSTADMRYLVMPMRPPGTDDWTEDQLAALVTRDSMIGVAPALDPASVPE